MQPAPGSGRYFHHKDERLNQQTTQDVVVKNLLMDLYG
jgi:hypothetical protein